MGLFDRFKKKKEETFNPNGTMINSTYRSSRDVYIRMAIREMGASGINGLDKDKLTKKLLYFYDNNLPVEERITILMNTFKINRKTAKKVEYVSFAKTALLGDYLKNKGNGATKFNIKNPNGLLKTNLNISEFPNYLGFMIDNDGVPIFNIKSKPKVVIQTKKADETETKTTDRTETKGSVGVKLGLRIPNKIDKAPEYLTELDKLINRQIELYTKMNNEEGYYGSDISREEFREFNNDVATYLENNPQDFITRGAKYNGALLGYPLTAPKDEVKIFGLFGKGLYYETDLKQYDEAIAIYNEADKLNMEFNKNTIRELVRDYGERDYLYSAKAKERINICNNKKKRAKIKELEAEAEELAKTNPAEAIEMYNYLNELNPDVQKYNKAICNIREVEAKELAKTNPAEAIKIYEELKELNPYVQKYDRAIFKIKELEAKELAKTNPAEAIKIYEELNILNPGLKKYDKAIIRIYEIEAKKLEETDPLEAIKRYGELNILNPGLKKYDKRIEIIKKKLDK